jgi:membrane-bound serine protease (ClpP class)
MKTAIAILGLGAALTAAPATDGAHTVATDSTVEWVKVDSEITNATASYIKRGLQKAEEQGSDAFVIELDTPGGLVSATWDIVESELNSNVPVIVWVSPRGAHAGSAGVFITLAANVAAMAPGTRIGAAHPVGIPNPPNWSPDSTPEPKPAASGTPVAAPTEAPGIFRFRSDEEHLAQKLENDTVAWVESIARQRGRNVQWAKDAVLNSVSIVAEDAVQKKVVDLIAADQEDLFKQVEGRTVKTAAGDRVLHLTSARVVFEPMSWREQFVAFLANPTLIALLGAMVMLGIYGEFSHPGTIFPAAAATICLVLLLVASQAVPINIAGLLLIMFGFLCFVLEIKFHSYLALTATGIACISGGLLLLVDQTKFTVGVSWPIIVPAFAAIAAIMVGITFLAVRAMRSSPLGDNREMIGRVVKVAAPLGPEGGTVLVDGVLWNAVSAVPVESGAHVRIVQAKDLTLTVVPDGAVAAAAPARTGAA